jgi:vanillate/3-O-methylgallate O-demethylase
MSNESFREQYARATDYRKPAFIERPLIGSPAAPAQAETNVSNLWGHINAGYLIGYEYTRWWHESRALRTTAVLGDWSWLNKTLVKGPDAQRFMNYATVKDLSRQQVGQAMYTPMVNADGKVAIEGLTWRLADDAFLFTQSGARHWFDYLHGLQDLNVTIEDVTPDYTCYALQGPRSREVLEAVTGEDWHDLRFSRWRKSTVNGLELMVGRQGVTGEIGYEFLAPTDSGKAHELWRTIREVGQDFGLREIGLKAMMVGHIETGIATVVRDFLPARIPPDELTKFALLWMSAEEVAALDWELSEQFCSPAELGWAHTIDLQGDDFHGRAALAEEAEAGGPARRLVGLEWDSDDMAALFAAQFRDAPAPPPFDLPTGQFRMQFLKVLRDGEQVGWASGPTYSANLRRMISLARLDKALAEPGNQVAVVWGAFSSEPRCEIRAKVVELPFIAQTRTQDLSAG